MYTIKYFHGLQKKISLLFLCNSSKYTNMFQLKFSFVKLLLTESYILYILKIIIERVYQSLVKNGEALVVVLDIS